jgi:hypothetical protein
MATAIATGFALPTATTGGASTASGAVAAEASTPLVAGSAEVSTTAATGSWSAKASARRHVASSSATAAALRTPITHDGRADSNRVRGSSVAPGAATVTVTWRCRARLLYLLL